MKRVAILTSIVTALAVVTSAFGATILSNPTEKFKLAYAKKGLVATAGSVTLRSKNLSPVLKHNIALRSGATAKSPLLKTGKVVGANGVSSVTVNLKKGTYRYVCTVKGHEAGGMWGILTVKASGPDGPRSGG